jgi:acetyltransferase
MVGHYLEPLFTPDSIALFGASDRVDAVGGVVFHNLLNSGFEAESTPLTPNAIRSRDSLHSPRSTT